MSVVGFDFGNQNCYISVARQGGIEVATNDHSLHATATCVQFGEKSRTMGTTARLQMMTKLKNTIHSFKNLVGRKFSDPVVQTEIPRFSCDVIQLPEDNIGLRTNYLAETRVLTPEQVTSILLGKLKTTVEAFNRSKICDCVISVPCFWTDVQRRALLDAAKIADLNCLRILNETTAVALAYGIYKQDLPVEPEKPRHVVFLDIGHSAAQAAVVAFNKGKLKVLGTAWDMNLSGRVLDERIREHFAKEFKGTYKIDVTTRPKAWLRLLDECEKLKKLMSANSEPIPLNIECLMDDKDVTGKMQRSAFEELCEDVWPRIRSLLERLLTDSKLKPADVEAVELVGGATRTPIVKQIVQELLGRPPATTLNQDDAVSRGCALQCAILSPTFRVREFSITDAQPFAIKLTWSAEWDSGEAVVFEEHHPFPFSKMLTFYRKEPFVLSASYNLPNHIPYPKTTIGQFKIEGVQPTPEGENSKVKVKIRLNPNGLFSVSSASMFEKATASDAEEQETQEPMDAQNQQQKSEDVENGPSENQESGAADGQSEEKMEAEEGKADKKEGEAEEKKPVAKPKPKIRSVELPIKEAVAQMSSQDLERFQQMELDMQRKDRLEKEKADSKNAVEEYSYEMRDKLLESLKAFVTNQDAERLSSMLRDVEDWIYDEGEDQPKDVYLEKLAEMKKLGDPIVERCVEAEERPKAWNRFGATLQRSRKFYEQHLAGDEKYNHIEAKDMERVRKALEEKQVWMQSQMNAQSQRPLTAPPVVFANQIIQEMEALERVVHPVMSKPKPKVEPPPEAPAPETGDPNPGPDAPAANGDSRQEPNMDID